MCSFFSPRLLAPLVPALALHWPAVSPAAPSLTPKSFIAKCFWLLRNVQLLLQHQIQCTQSLQCLQCTVASSFPWHSHAQVILWQNASGETPSLTTFLGFLESRFSASLRGQIFSGMQHHDDFFTIAIPSPTGSESQSWEGGELFLPWKLYLSVNDCSLYLFYFYIL